VKVIVEPNDGVAPLVSAIRNAKKSVEIVIFRFDHRDIEAALKAAVGRGVKVTALTGYTNRGGEAKLRQLEMRFLDAGIIVARSADDLTRYHDKLLIIDRRVLYMLSFNYTHVDIDHSRGFGIVTRNAEWVQEAGKLLEADSMRCAYEPGLDSFVVSPVNSRKVLARFIRRARKELLIYDPRISDKEMIGILQDHATAGVVVRILGRIDEGTHLTARKLNPLRLHARTIIRDRRQVFVGSQSLRSAALDSRREVGLIVGDPKVVKTLIATFESDWGSAGAAKPPLPAEKAPAAAPEKQTEDAVQVLARDLGPLTDTVKKAVKKVVAKAGEEVLEDKVVKETVKKVVKKVVKKAVKEAVEEVAQDAKKA